MGNGFIAIPALPWGSFVDLEITGLWVCGQQGGNWDPPEVPASADDVYFEDNAVNVCWGLDQNAVDLDELVIRQSYTGKLGLNSKVFATSSDGDTTNTSKPEYRAELGAGGGGRLHA